MNKRIHRAPGKHEEMTYIGIDNGVSGSVAFVTEMKASLFPTPVKSELSYTKTKRNITRVSVGSMTTLLKSVGRPARVFIERPMVNPRRFQATVSALRALEATLIAIESLNLPLQYVDSRQWQKELLPNRIKGTTDLKKASHDIGFRMFPDLVKQIEEIGDADALLIAEWARRNKQ